MFDIECVHKERAGVEKYWMLYMLVIEKASEDEITMKTSKHIFPFMQQELQNYLDMLNGKKVDAKL